MNNDRLHYLPRIWFVCHSLSVHCFKVWAGLWSYYQLDPEPLSQPFVHCCRERPYPRIGYCQLNPERYHVNLETYTQTMSSACVWAPLSILQAIVSPANSKGSVYLYVQACDPCGVTARNPMSLFTLQGPVLVRPGSGGSKCPRITKEHGTMRYKNALTHCTEFLGNPVSSLQLFSLGLSTPE